MTDRRTDSHTNQPPAGREAALTVLAAAGTTRGVALVLHGGKAHSYEAVESRHLSPLRMVTFARHLHRAGKDHGLAVWSLRNRVRGWNGPDRSALQDARWALQQISAQHPGLPVYLVGHSMGGLTAVSAADDPQVDAVVALAPWLSPETPATPLTGRKVLIVHGTADHMTSPSQSLAFARRASGVAASMQYVSLHGAGHFMVRRGVLWHRLATGFVMKAFAECTGFRHSASRTLAGMEPGASPEVAL